MANSITVKWLGHSCFKLTYGDASVVIDPYDKVRGFPLLKCEANMAIASHGHGDHGYMEAVTVTPYAGEFPFEIRTVDSWHDDSEGSKRGPNLLHIISAGGLTAAHFGDLGHELSAEQIAAVGKCDLLMIPVGGHYTIDCAAAKKVCDAVQPKVILPMHYREGEYGFDVLSEVTPFLAYYEGVRPVRRLETDTYELTADSPEEVITLTFGK